MSFKPMWRHSKPLALPETSPASSGARQHNHGPRPLLALDSQHGKSRRQQHGRGVGIESTVDKASDKNIGGFPFCGVCRKTREPTSGFEPLYCSLRVIIHALQGIANPAFLIRFLCSVLPCVAPYCVPGGVKVVSISPPIYLGNGSLALVLQLSLQGTQGPYRHARHSPLLHRWMPL